MNAKVHNLLLVALLLGAVLAAPTRVNAADALFVGVKGCQTCHSVSHRDHYHDWLATKHATAFEALAGKDRENPKCLGCHSTGYGGKWAQGVTAADLRGVQCEACHGPGSLYRPRLVMKNHQAALEKGLLVPTRQTCLRCHQ